MVQISVDENMPIALDGMLAGTGSPEITPRANSTPKTDGVTIDAADLATTCTINGTAVTVNSGAAAKTKTELRDLLIAAINADSSLNVVASIKDADELYVASDTPGVTTTVVGTTNCTVAVIFPNDTSIPYGTGVVLDAINGEEFARTPNLVADVETAHSFIGIAVRPKNVANDNNTGFTPLEAMGVLEQGEIWVPTEVDVVYGDPVYCRAIAGAGETRGHFRNDADTADAGLVKGARFVSTRTGGRARVEINLPTT